MTTRAQPTNPTVEALREELVILLGHEPSLAKLVSLARQAEFVGEGTSSDGHGGVHGLSGLGCGSPRMAVYWSNLTGVFNAAVFEVLGLAHDTPSSRFSWVGIAVSTALKIKSVNGEVVCIVTHSPDQGNPIHFRQRVILDLPKVVSGTEIPVRNILERFPHDVEILLGHIASIISVLFDREDD